MTTEHEPAKDAPIDPLDPLARLDKGVSGIDGPISRYLNRPVSGLISSRVARLPVTPNQWTYASFGCGCAGAVAFAVGSPRAAAVLVHAGALLDEVDGEVARLKGMSSAEGALLDMTLDRVSDVALLGGLALGAGGRRLDWLLALTAAYGIITAGAMKERVGASGRSVAQLQLAEASGGNADRLLPFTSSDGRLFAVALLGLLKRPRLALLWLAGAGSLRLLRRLHAARLALSDEPGR